MHYTYLLQSKKDHKLYTGYTVDLPRRLKQHNEGKVLSTKSRLPLELVYYEACINEADAKAREKYLKSGMGKRYLKNRLKSSLTSKNLSRISLSEPELMIFEFRIFNNFWSVSIDTFRKFWELWAKKGNFGLGGRFWIGSNGV